MILVERKYDCTGCSMCKNICTQNAITMEKDEKGFLYPKIDNQKCVNCGICKKKCPNIAQKNSENKELKIYAMKNKSEEIRNESSSGGFFYEYASIILKENGTIYGAAYNDKNEVEHIKIDKKEELYKLQGSKYVQSEIKEVYSEVIKDLKEERKVLFSGTPCQVNGLNKLLEYKKIKKDKLYTCDLICHGVPSPKVYQDYLRNIEKMYDSKVVKVNFRHKENDYTQNIKIELQNGKEYISNYFKNDIFYKAFLKDYILRESCFECKYCSFNRVADITIGDFWGIEKNIKNFDDKKGVSLVLINTTKGKEIFEEVKRKFIVQETCKEHCVQDNLVKPRDKINEYKKIWEEYEKEGIQVLEKYI